MADIASYVEKGARVANRNAFEIQPTWTARLTVQEATTVMAVM